MYNRYIIKFNTQAIVLIKIDFLLNPNILLFILLNKYHYFILVYYHIHNNDMLEMLNYSAIKINSMFCIYISI